MSAYLGTLGRLVPIYSNPTMKTSGDDKYTFSRTLEGRVKAQVSIDTRRTWELSAHAATTTDIGSLTGFISGEWGVGPFVWVAPDAPSTNLLTPEVASCGPAAAYGANTYVGAPVDLGGNIWAGRSILNTDPTAVLYFSNQRTPILPGVPVTGSAWLLGAGSRARLHWYGADGAGLGVEYGESTGVATKFTRLSVTGKPPAGAVACGVSAMNAMQGARPAITWTEEPFPWGEGCGCLKAVVSSIGRTALAASSRESGRVYSDVSFTITEVG